MIDIGSVSIDAVLSRLEGEGPPEKPDQDPINGIVAAFLDAVLGSDLAILRLDCEISRIQDRVAISRLVKIREHIDAKSTRGVHLQKQFEDDRLGNLVDPPKPLVGGARPDFLGDEQMAVALNLPAPDPRRVARQATLDVIRVGIRSCVSAVDERAGGDSAARAAVEPAIAALGKVRAAEAVPVLVKHLTFAGTGRPEKFAGPMPLSAALPAVAALVEIDAPAINPLLDRALGDDDEAVTTCAGVALQRILGTELAVAAARLRVGPGADAARARRLDRLIQRINRAGAGPAVPQPAQP